MLLFYILVFFSIDIRDLEINEWRLIDSIQSLLDFLMDDELVSFSYIDDEMFSFSFEESMDLECCCVFFVVMENFCCLGCWYVFKDEDGFFKLYSFFDRDCFCYFGEIGSQKCGKLLMNVVKIMICSDSEDID